MVKRNSIRRKCGKCNHNNDLEHVGGAIRMPSEYFGGDSGRYSVDPNAGRCASSYGYTNAQSFGGQHAGNQVGPNMHAHPGGSGLHTGGRRRRRRRSAARRSTARRSAARRSVVRRSSARRSAVRRRSVKKTRKGRRSKN